MKKLIAVVLIVAFALPAFAIVEGSEVLYEGGSAQGVKQGTMGAFDTTSDEALVFHGDGAKLSIPYAKMTNFQYEEKLARHYGVLLTIAIVMFKYRQRRHILTVSYNDDQDAPRVAVFEVSKEAPETIVPLIHTNYDRYHVKQANEAARKEAALAALDRAIERR
jgi:hypothetical protein